MKRKNKMKKKVKVREKKINMGPFKILTLTLAFLLGGFFAVASAYFTSEGIKRLRNSSYFYVKSLRISGAKMIPEPRIVDIIKNGKKDINIFEINPSRIREDLMKENWIKDANVQRIFPDTVHVEVQERTPVARVHLADGEYLVDEEGIIFLKVDKGFQNLPLVLGEFNREDLASIGKIIKEYISFSGSLPKEIVFDSFRIRITDQSGTLVNLDRERMENMRYLKWTFDYIRSKGIFPRAIDMGYPQKAVLQF